MQARERERVLHSPSDTHSRHSNALQRTPTHSNTPDAGGARRPGRCGAGRGAAPLHLAGGTVPGTPTALQLHSNCTPALSSALLALLLRSCPSPLVGAGAARHSDYTLTHCLAIAGARAACVRLARRGHRPAAGQHGVRRHTRHSNYTIIWSAAHF